jgi:hypothetical protein
MGIQRRPINVRLTEEQAAQLDRLSRAMPALPKANLVRLLLSSALEGGLEDQIQRVTKQLVDPAALTKPPTRRLPSNNPNSSRAT